MQGLCLVYHLTPTELARMMRTMTMTMVMMMSGFTLRTDWTQYLESCFRMFSTILICLFIICLLECDFHDLSDLAHLAHSCNPNTQHGIWPIVGVQQICAVCLVSKFLWSMCNPTERSSGISSPILVHTCFFHSRIMRWLQAIPLYPVYHGDETESGRNHRAVWHHLKTLRVCGFRLLSGAMRLPRTQVFSVFHFEVFGVIALPPVMAARLMR